MFFFFLGSADEVPGGGVENGETAPSQSPSNEAGKNSFQKVVQSAMDQINSQSKKDIQEMMQSAISAITSETANVASQTNDVLTASEKIEDRKRKLELEINESTNEDHEKKTRAIIDKLDKKIGELCESL